MAQKGSSSKKLSNQTLYKKLRSDGTIDPSNLNQSDYDQVAKYIKTTFPQATRVQKEIDQTLKRTFIFGRTEDSRKDDKSLGLIVPKTKPVLNRRTRLRLQQAVPKKLDFQQFLRLNSLWKAYVAELCGTCTDPTEIQGKLNKVDLHGAYITVVQSHCQDYKDIAGIVVKETRNTFVLVTRSNFTKTIPKPESVFDVTLDNPNGLRRIAGNSFLTRPAERACKKIKSFMNFIGPKAYKSSLKYGRIEKT